MNILNMSGFAHGGDYNPDQWLDYPEILKEDIRLMKKAHVNLLSVGIFAWAALEPEEGKYEFGWLKKIIGDLYENGISVLLATPSGARPRWMAEKYPEVLRVENGHRNLFGGRHNHCFTSPVYREKVRLINTALAKEFGAHPGVKGWHISNEYSGQCRCEYCKAAFRDFVKERYGTVDKLNAAWWTAFWSKTYRSFDEIEPPERDGETSLTGLSLTWQRFICAQTKSFIENEIAPIRAICPDKPVTINTMGFHYDYDYAHFSDILNFYGYDSYPTWGSPAGDEAVMKETAFTYDYVRGFNGGNWSLMESTPSQVNWHETCKLKKPGMHLLSSLQAIAHGSDTVMMFQWRKGRGGPEKFHGAVVGHDGTGDTRVFREVTEVGETLEKLQPMYGSSVKSEVALIYDRETEWALNAAQGPHRDKRYNATLRKHYEALIASHVNVDVINADKPFDGYKVITAPYLYMLRPGVSEKLKTFVKNGGTLLVSYMSGLVNEDDLCFMGGFPGEIGDLLGIVNTETDALYDGQTNGIVTDGGTYKCGFTCALVKTTTAETVGRYESDFYAGTPALTVNRYGQGEAWYLASDAEDEMLTKLYAKFLAARGIRPLADAPRGVDVASREKDGKEFVFLMNFTDESKTVSVSGTNVMSGEKAASVTLPSLGWAVIER